jgi:hypothetical protein
MDQITNPPSSYDPVEAIESEKKFLLNKTVTKREIFGKIVLISLGVCAVGTVAVGAYILLKRSPKVKIAAELLAASSINVSSKIKPEFLKVPDFMYSKISDVKTGTYQLLDFLKVVQYDPSFVDRRNIVQSELLLTNIYDRMENLVALQQSPDFNERSMRSLERIIFMLCKKSLTHQSICKKLETKQLINGLIMLLDKHPSNKT